MTKTERMLKAARKALEEGRGPLHLPALGWKRNDPYPIIVTVTTVEQLEQVVENYGCKAFVIGGELYPASK